MTFVTIFDCFQCIYALCDLGCNIEAKNTAGDTALHIMIQRQRLGCMMALLSRSADASSVGSGGNNALHLCIQVCCLCDQPKAPRHVREKGRVGHFGKLASQDSYHIKVDPGPWGFSSDYWH